MAEKTIIVFLQFTEGDNQQHCSSSAISVFFWQKEHGREESSLERKFFCRGFLLAHYVLHVPLGPNCAQMYLATVDLL